MVDPLIGAAANEFAKAGGGVLSRLLGPTADEMGTQLHRWYTRKNVERVVERAEAKADTTRDGSIPPRVAAEVFDKAQWADDAFMAEYLSGVLATARTPEGTDDRAISWTSLVARLSSDQLRLHYIIFREFRRLGLGVEHEALTEVLGKPLLFRQEELRAAMGLPAEDASFNRILEATYGLIAEGLLDDYISHGDAEYMNRINRGKYIFPRESGTYVVLYCTTRGASLFLYAHGKGDAWASAILAPEIELVLDWPEGQDVVAAKAQWKDDFEETPE